MAFDLQTRDGEILATRAATIIWVALIAALSVGGSLAFACAAPLAAVAALAGCKMERGAGLALVVAAWLSNQVIGYGVLGYPQTFHSFAWGAAIGGASILAFFGAHAASASAGNRPLSLAIGFLAAFAIYEFALYLAGIPLSGSAEAFSMPIVTRIFEINVVAFAGLLIFHRLAVAVSLLPGIAAHSPEVAVR
ncbi:hypothetical protein [Hyphomicrobium sp.]|uniref:hypothetical protein n=1 Tax=Hyphomicrobium sp. TaxID=82 RepID=UPI002C7B0C06|nr:hypothetical protein [Hyphomicrobium sp.]HVZ04738.1 hypothetical protein [Hyphomicrobium sp.]